jgi:cell division protein FtsB
MGTSRQAVRDGMEKDRADLAVQFQPIAALQAEVDLLTAREKALQAQVDPLRANEK